MQLLVDLKNGFYTSVTHPPVSLAGNTNGTGVDLVNSANIRTQMVIMTGTITGAGLFNYTVQESDDNTTFVAAADSANANTGNINTANSATVISFNRTKRYVRSLATLVSGTSVIASGLFIAQKSPDGSNTAGYSVSPQT